MRTTHQPLANSRFSGLAYPGIFPATVVTAGNATLTTDQLLGGLYLRSTSGAARSDTLPTAAALVEAIPGAFAGTSFEWIVTNNATAAETITIVPGTGGTASGTMTIAQNNSKVFLVLITNATIGSEAYTIYSLGTAVT